MTEHEAFETNLYVSPAEHQGASLPFRTTLDRLGKRARNVLDNNGICTIVDFLALTTDDISGFRSAGTKTISELVEMQRMVRENSSTGLIASEIGQRPGLPSTSIRDPLYRVVLDLLKRSGRPMHLTEIRDELLSNGIDATKHQVDEAISMSTTFEKRFELLKWGKGISIHRQYVVPPYELVREIEGWISGKFAEGYAVVMATVVFKEFKGKCLAAGVPTAAALYSCLRACGANAFCFPRYAKIAIANNLAAGNIPLDLEEYIRDARRPVSRAELKDYATAKFLISETALASWLMKVANIIRVEHGMYVHASLL